MQRIYLEKLAARLHANGVNPGQAAKYATIAKAAIKAGADEGTAIQLARQAYYVNEGFHWNLESTWALQQAAKRNAVRGNPRHTLLKTEPHLAACV
jgi:hypothetical protein